MDEGSWPMGVGGAPGWHADGRDGTAMGGRLEHPHVDYSDSASTSTKFYLLFSLSFCLIEPFTAIEPTIRAENKRTLIDDLIFFLY